MKNQQKILAVKTTRLFPNGIVEGVIREGTDKILGIIDKEGEYILRSEAEEDESYQQIIPQILLKVGEKVFIHRIPNTGGEQRLHDMWPLFLGGHVEETDSDIDSATEREFREEINYPGKIIMKTFIGLIKLHDDKPVNRVHVGLVWIYEGDSLSFEPTEDAGLIDGRFIDISELPKYQEKMNYWSQIFLNEYPL